MLRAIRRPSWTARGSIENWSLSSTMSAMPLLIWLPEPIAHARVARPPDPVGDRRHRLTGVPRDQLQVDLLLAHELDRLGGVGPQPLLEHDERAGLEPWGWLGDRIRWKASRRHPEGDHAPPRRGVLVEGALKGGR